MMYDVTLDWLHIVTVLINAEVLDGKAKLVKVTKVFFRSKRLSIKGLPGVNSYALEQGAMGDQIWFGSGLMELMQHWAGWDACPLTGRDTVEGAGRVRGWKWSNAAWTSIIPLSLLTDKLVISFQSAVSPPSSSSSSRDNRVFLISQETADDALHAGKWPSKNRLSNEQTRPC